MVGKRIIAIFFCVALVQIVFFANAENQVDLKPVLVQDVAFVYSQGIAVEEVYDSFVLAYLSDYQIQAFLEKGIRITPLPDITKLQVGEYEFDTRFGEPSLPPDLKVSYVSSEKGYYIVQLKGPVKTEWLAEMKKYGVEIVGVPLRNYAYIVKMNGLQKNLLLEKHFVNWIGIYQPAYRIRLNLACHQPTDLIRVNVVFFKNDDFQNALPIIKKYGEIEEYDVDTHWWNVLRLKVPVKFIKEIACLPGVEYIELYEQPIFYNNVACWVVQSYSQSVTSIWAKGIHGEGIVVGGADSGVDYDHIAFRNTQSSAGTPGSSHRKIVRYTGRDGQDSAWDGYGGGHGTHTMGSIVGDSITNPGGYDTYDGMAYAAKLAFYDANQPGDGYGVVLPPLSTVFNDAHQYGARSHSNSWGSPSLTSYDTMARACDQFQWDHSDFLIFAAAGNNNEVTSPAIAKNVVTVGATYNGLSQSLMPGTGRGPTLEGVRKPDIVAPGVQITSCKSDGNLNSLNNGYAAGSGTSMSCPIAAGATALVEQYFREGWYPTGSKNPADGFMPSGPLRKAILINSAWSQSGADAPIPDNSQGWGKIKLDDALYFAGETRKLWLEDGYHTGTKLATGQTKTYNLNVYSGTPFEVSLVWNDYPGAGLQNNLDLVVKAPNGNVYKGSVYQNGQSVTGGTADNKNPVECVYLPNPVTGQYTIEITATSIAAGTQSFAIVATGDVAEQPPQPLVAEVQSPNGGEILIGGTTTSIRWRVTGGMLDYYIDVYYDTNSGLDNYPNFIGRYLQTAEGLHQITWSVPPENSDKVRIKIVATDARLQKAEDTSNADFTIRTAIPSVEVTSPNGGEKLKGNSNYNIVWSATGGTEPLQINLYYSTDGGQTYPNIIKTGLQNNPPYGWLVPAINSNKVRVKVEVVDANGITADDESNADFTIDSQPPAVTIKTPSGGERWGKGLHTIAWEVVEPNLGSLPINLSYSTDDGRSWTSIGAFPNITQYNWNIPETIVNSETSRVKVEVTDEVGHTNSAISNRFTIDTVPPEIIHLPVRNALKNRPIEISATVTDAIQVQQVTLWYKNVGATTGTITFMTLTSGSEKNGKWVAQIPSSSATSNLEYRLNATDGINYNQTQKYLITVYDVATTGTIKGYVKDAITTEPLVNARLILFAEGNACGSAYTDQTGYYEIVAIPHGSYKLEALCNGYASKKQDVIVKAGDTITVNFELYSEATNLGTLAGFVTDKDGKPIADATVTVGTMPSVKTDPSGYYIVRGIPAGTYEVTVEKEGYETKKESVTIYEHTDVQKDFTLLKITIWYENILLYMVIFIIIGCMLAAIFASRRRKEKKVKVPEVRFQLPVSQQRIELRRYLWKEAQYPQQPQQGEKFALPVTQTQMFQQYLYHLPQQPQESQQGELKVCKKCGKLNEKWRLSCKWCKAGLGGL